MVLKYGGTQKSWSLSKVDRSGALNRGVSLTFATGVKPKPNQTIQAYFKNVPGKGKTLIYRASFNKHVKTAREPYKTQAAVTLGPGRMMARKVRPGTKKPRIVPMELTNRGILITQPAGGEKFYQGETIQIRYRITRPGFTGENITFHVFNRAGLDMGSITVPLGTNPVSLRLREGLASGAVSGFVIVAEAGHAPNSIYGESVDFEIHPNSAQIEFFQPDAGDVAHRGGHLNILYRLSRRVSPGPVTFELHSLTSSTVFASTTVNYVPSAPDAEQRPVRTTRRAELFIPPDAPYGDDYFITATHAKALGTSDTFAIAPFGEGGPDNTSTWSMWIVSPVRPVIWHPGDVKTIVFHIYGNCTTEHRFVLEFMNGSTVLFSRYFGDLRRFWDESSHNYSIPLLIPEINTGHGPFYGSECYIRIRDLKSTVDTQGPMVIAYTPHRPSLNFRIIDTTSSDSDLHHGLPSLSWFSAIELNVKVYGAARGPFDIYLVKDDEPSVRYPIASHYTCSACPSIRPVEFRVSKILIAGYQRANWHIEVHSASEPDLEVTGDTGSFTISPPEIFFFAPEPHHVYRPGDRSGWGFAVRFALDIPPGRGVQTIIQLHKIDGRGEFERDAEAGQHFHLGQECNLLGRQMTCYRATMDLPGVPAGVYELVIRLQGETGLTYTSEPFTIEQTSQ